MLKYRIIASGTEFDRKMRQILRGPADARTTTLPKSVKTIAKEAFSETISLKSAILDENLEIIGPGAFQMSGLRRVRISVSTKEIWDHAFSDCRDLKSVEFAQNCKLTRIGAWCFQNSGLEEVTFPKSLKTIENGAFFGCKCLRRVALNEGLLAIGRDDEARDCGLGVFQSSRLVEVTLPGTLRDVGVNIFTGCANLRAVRVEDGCEAGFSRSVF